MADEGFVEDSCMTCNAGGCDPANHTCYGCIVFQKELSAMKGVPVPEWAENRWGPADWFLKMEELRAGLKKKDDIIEMHEKIGELVFLHSPNVVMLLNSMMEGRERRIPLDVGRRLTLKVGHRLPVPKMNIDDFNVDGENL